MEMTVWKQENHRMETVDVQRATGTYWTDKKSNKHVLKGIKESKTKTLIQQDIFENVCVHWIKSNYTLKLNFS